VRRREFIAGLGAAAWPLAARAQQGDRVRRIGVLMPFDETDPEEFLYSAFTQALADLGWTGGRNVRMDLRWGGGDTNRIQALAQELVGLQPDIILAIGLQATIALQRQTRTIPIVFANVGDPVALGIVPRFNQPGGNITGFADFEPAMGGKWLELLSEIALGLKRAAIMFDSDTSAASAFRPLIVEAARSLKVIPIAAPVRNDVEIEAAIIALGREPGGGLAVMPGGARSGIARRSYRRRPDITYRRYMGCLTLSETAACSPTEPTRQTSFVAPPLMSIAFYAAKSRAISRCSFRQNLRWSSTSRPPRGSASLCPNRSCCAPTR
jgi:ABC transporter substrate binding protein